MQRLAISFCLALAALFPGAALAESPLLVAPDQRPYGFVKDGRLSGLLLELGQAVAQEAGHEAAVVLLPMDTAVDALSTGDADLLLSGPNFDLNKHGLDAGEVVRLDVAAVALAGSGIRTARTLRGKRVAVVRDPVMKDAAEAVGRLIPIPVNDYADAVRLLAAGEVDAALGGLAGLTDAMGALPPRLFGRPIVVGSRPVHLYLSASHYGAAEVERFTKAIDKLRRTGRIRAIVAEYSL